MVQGILSPKIQGTKDAQLSLIPPLINNKFVQDLTAGQPNTVQSGPVYQGNPVQPGPSYPGGSWGTAQPGFGSFQQYPNLGAPYSPMGMQQPLYPGYGQMHPTFGNPQTQAFPQNNLMQPMGGVPPNYGQPSQMPYTNNLFGRR